MPKKIKKLTEAQKKKLDEACVVSVPTGKSPAEDIVEKHIQSHSDHLAVAKTQSVYNDMLKAQTDMMLEDIKRKYKTSFFLDEAAKMDKKKGR